MKEIILNAGNSNNNFGDVFWSNSIACSTNGDIFVADRFDNRVLVFNKEFIYKYQFGSKGPNTGQFNEPADICFSESGKLFIADKNNYRIQIYSEVKKNRESKGVKMATSLSFHFENLFAGLETPHTMKTAKSQTTVKSKSVRVGGEYCYHNYIDLDDKPVKLCSSPFSGIMAVSTINGMV